jgi:uncharacterized protein
MREPLEVLIVTKGHPFEAEPFFEVFDANPDIRWSHVEHPEAQAYFTQSAAAKFDAIVCYDMPGIRFTHADPPAEFDQPPPSYVAGLTQLLEAGKGIVFLHHAVAGWPAWEGYARIVGARFHYQPAVLAGVAYPDSGYHFDVTHHIDVLDPTHPVCAGLGNGFSLTDELYLFPVLEDRVLPLLRTQFPMDDPTKFSSADLAIRGTRNSNEGWTHPAGSQLVGWVKHAGRSPIAYLQFGDGPITYADPNFRRVLANAIGWVASSDAHNWAQHRAAGAG